jgi:two-component system NarL family response regulator
MNKEERIRVMIVEDHYVVRIGLAAIINKQSDMVVVTEAENGDSAVELFVQHQPDLTLMDLRIPGLGGLEAISIIKRKFPNARIIVLSTYGGDEDVYKAVQAGARAYFLKDVKGSELIKAMRAVHEGQQVFPPEITARLADRIYRTELSLREVEVLKLISEGKSNKEVARLLFISSGTVRAHASNIFAKLGCNDRAQAVAVAFKRGIIHSD